MRIVAGTLGGRRLAAPPGRATRPTSDKVREAVFAILGAPPPGAQVLDLFAGSGAMAIEAVSRGADAATAVESARGALATLRGNLRDLGIADRVAVVAGDALGYLRAARPAAPWTWVFLDPPYASPLGGEALTALAAAPGLLAPDPVIAIEHDRRHLPPPFVGTLVLTDQRRYGDTLVSFFRRREADRGASP